MNGWCGPAEDETTSAVVRGVYAVLAIAAVALLLLVMGCGTVETRTETRTTTNVVKVPVSVACVSANDMPKLPARTTVDTATATTDQLAAATAADAEAYEQYSRAISAILAQCAAVKVGK